MTDEKKKLDYRGKLILAPMVKVKISISQIWSKTVPGHE
jgi:hypothetical protein